MDFHALLPQAPTEATVAPTGFYTQTPTESNPTRIGGYEILRELGSGGMGRVFEALDKESGRSVALKILSCPKAKRDADAVERFLREGQLAAKVSHPRSTFVYEAGFANDQPFIAMELMPGRTLADELRETGRLELKRAVDAILDVIDGLQAAHQIGVVHRDVKPSNCFIEDDGRIKIGDFGLSKSLVANANLTRTGTFMGTPSFASPEQVRGAKVDHRTDIYSIGATLYELLTGRPPFVGDAMSVTAQIISDFPDRLRKHNPQIPKGVEQIVLQAIEKDPEKRFQDLDAIRSSLLPFASQGTSLAQTGRRVAAFMMDYFSIQLLFQIAMALVGLLLAYQMHIEISAMSPEEMMNFKSKIATMQNWGGIANWFFAVGWFSVWEWSTGATLGKQLMGIRVTNSRGERPNLWRSTLRSFAIPGGFGILLITAVARFWSDPTETFTTEHYLYVWVTNILTLTLLGLFCFSTMRQSNGMRGIHDLLSGTHVIQLFSARFQSKGLNASLPIKPCHQVLQFGRFKATGELRSNTGNANVLIGLDETLDRKALIFRNCGADSNSACVFKNVNRATRSRWLQSGFDENGLWNAFEYFGGVPFSFVVTRMRNVDWTEIKNAIFDLTRELEAAVSDQTLPQRLSFDYFMIGTEGHGRLIDFPVNITGQSKGLTVGATKNPSTSDIERANELLRNVLDWCLTNLPLSEPTTKIINDFRRRSSTLQSITILKEQLDIENRRESRLYWDSRIGVLAASAGLEWPIITGVISLLSWILFSRLDYFPIWKTACAWVFVLLGCYFLGKITKGGPAFQFLGIELRNKKGQPAASWLCGLRMALSWSAICASAILAPCLVDVGLSRMNENNPADVAVFEKTITDQLPSVPTSQSASQHSMEFNAMLIVSLVASIITFAGAVVSVASPQRGIPDFILGTRLRPK